MISNIDGHGNIHSEGEAMKKAPTIITGTVGMDAHVIGTKVVSRALKDAGFTVVELGMQVTPEEFISVAQETNADAILMTSLYGMAELDLKGFNEKRMEAGLGDILLYIGGNLVIGRYDPREVEPKFKALGFDRVYPPETDIVAVIEDDLKKDLKARGKM
jgi:methylaspartate mutase S subunit